MAALSGLLLVQGTQAMAAVPDHSAPALPSVPQQGGGTAAGRSHQVAASATGPRVGSRRSAAPGRVKGAEGRYAPHPVDHTPHASGTLVHKAPRPVTPKTRALGSGRQTGVEQPSLDTETSTVYKNADGTYTARVYTRPVNYRAHGGAWRRIDRTLVPRSGRLAKTADGDAVSFAPSAATPRLALYAPDAAHSLALGLSGARDVTARTVGDTVTYPGVLPHTALSLEAMTGGFHSTLALDSKDAPHTFVFPLSLDGLTARLDDDRVDFTDAAGTVRMTMPAENAHDSAGKLPGTGAVSPVRYALTTVAGRPAVRVTLPGAWLDSPARVFPVVLDPPVEAAPETFPSGQGNASGATYVESGVSGNFNGNGDLYAGQYQGHNYNSFLQFSGFGTQFANDYVLGSTLWLDTEYSGLSATGTCAAQAVNVAAVTAAWSPGQLSTYPGPATGAQIGTASFSAGTDCSNGRQWEGVPLSPTTMMNWAHNWAPNNGLAVTAPNTSDAAKEFYANDPYLSVQYAPNGVGASYSEVTYASPWNNKTGWAKVTVQNRGSATWTPTNGYKLSYQIYTISGSTRTLDSAATPVPAVMPKTVVPNQPVTVTATLPALTPGGAYQVCWDMTYNGTAFSTEGVAQTCYALPVVNNPPLIDTFTPDNNGVVYSLTPTLGVTAHDPDNYPGTGLHYSFSLYANGSTTALATSGSLTTPTWTVPSGKLSWASTYYWTAQVTDGQTASLWSAPDYFSVPSAAQPLVTSHLGVAPYDSSIKGVDPQLGDYSTQDTDSSIPGIADGPALQMQRTYNSLDPRAYGAFGAGWSSVLDMRATQDSDGSGDVVVTLATGRQERFGANGDGTFSPPPGDNAQLKTGSWGRTGYTLIDASGMRYIFTEAATDPVTNLPYYGLTEFGNRNGHGLGVLWGDETLTLPSGGTTTAFLPGYLGYSSDQDNGLNDGETADTFPYGLILAFNWGVQPLTTTAGTTVNVPHITSAQTWVSGGHLLDTWTYGYNAANALTSVCPPATETTTSAECTAYNYTSGAASGSHFASMVTDSNPTDYWRLDDASGAATASDSVVVNQGSTDATLSNVTLGQAGALAGSPATSASFNGTSSRMVLPSGLVASSNNLSVGMWFKTTQAGGTLFSYQSGASGAAVSSNYTPALYVGSDGKLRGEFWDGTISPMTTTKAVNDGKWHYAVLVGARTSQTLYLDGAQAATRTGATIAVTGEPYTTVGAGELAGNWPSAPSGSALGWFKGQIQDVSFLQHPMGLPAVEQEYSAGTLPAAELTGVTLPSGKTQETLTYDALTDRVSSLTDANGGTYQFDTPVTTGSNDSYYGAVRGTRPQFDYPMTEQSGMTATNTYGTDAPADGSSDATYNDVMLGEPGIFGPAGDTAVGFNGTDSTVSLPQGAFDDAGGSAGVAMWFSTKASGEVLFSYQNVPIGTASPTHYVPALYIGTDGLLYGQFWDGKVAPMVSKTAVNDGNWHLVEMTASGTAQTLWIDGQSVATRTGTTITNHADSTGETYVTLGAGWTAGTWPKIPTANPQGYFTGEIAQAALYRTNADQTAPGSALGLYKAKGSSSGLTPSTTLMVTDPASHTETYTFDPTHGDRTTAITDALGHATTYSYDTSGFQDSTTDPDGHAVTLQHDPFGNVLARTTCRASDSCQTAYFSYHTDASDPMDPLNGKVLYASDARSGTAGTTDTAHRTAYTYTPAGDLATVTTPPTPDYPNGRTTKYTYYTSNQTLKQPSGRPYAEPYGMLAMVTDPRGLVTKYHYCDGLDESGLFGQLCTETLPTGQVTQYVYNALDQLETKMVVSDTFPQETDQLGLPTARQRTDFTYDALNRIATETDPATTDAVRGVTHTPVTTSAYDADGNLLTRSVADSTGGDITRTTSYTYDAADRLRSTTDPAGGTTSYTYDDFGRKSTTTNADGVTYAYAYSPASQLTTTTLLGYTGDPTAPSSPTDEVVDSRAYDPAGRLASETDAMGRTTSYAYFDDDLLQAKTSATGTPQAVTTAYGYDAAGNKSSECDGWTATSCADATTYTVDNAGRTTTTTQDPAGADRVTTDTFDPDDNVLSQILTGGGRTERTGFTYDALGDVTSQSVRTDTSGPTGVWNLADGDANAVDSSGNGNTGTPAGGATWSPPGQNAATFDGTSGAITTAGPVVDTTGDFTVSAWVYLNATSTTKDYTAVSQDGTHTSAFQLEYNHTTKTWGFLMPSDDANTPTTVYNATSNAPAQAGTWTHLVGVFTSGTNAMELYVNGILVSGPCLTCTADEEDATPIASTGPLAIGRGRSAGVAANFFPGKIRDVQIYDRPLKDGEVTQLYDSSTAPGESSAALGASGWWKLDDGESPTAADFSGTGDNGTLSGNVTWSQDHNGSAVFDGTTGAISTGAPTVDTSGDFSIAAWAKLTATPAGTQQTVVTQQGTHAAGFSLDYDAADNRWAFDRATTDEAAPTLAIAKSTAVPALNTWAHLVGTYDASAHTGTLYVNGTAQGTATDSTPFASVGPLVIGRGFANSAAAQYFHGAVSGVQTYGRALTAAEVATLHTSGGTAGTAPSTTTWTYDERGVATSTTDPRGNLPGAAAADYTTTYTNDEDGRTTTTTSPAVATEAYGVPSQPAVAVAKNGYDTFGGVAESEDPDGDITTNTFDGDGRALDVSRQAYTAPGTSTPVIATTSQTYDDMGQPVTQTDALNHTATYTYDQFGDQVRAVLPGDRAVHTVYDLDQEPTSVTDPSGAQTDSTYDAVGNEVTSTQAERFPTPTAETTTYAYDVLGNRTGITDPMNGVTTTSYDALGDPLAVKDPRGDTTSYAYDLAGRPTTVTAPDGTRIVSHYDQAGELTGSSDQDASGTTLFGSTYTYDAAGNRTSSSDPGSATVTSTYDALNRVTSQSQPAADDQTAPQQGGPVIVTDFGYDAAGNETDYTDPNKAHTYSTYNSLGLLESTVDPALPGDSSPADRTTTYTYDADSRPVTVTRPGGVTLTDVYDTAGDLTSQSGTGAEASTATRAFGYDAAGRTTSVSAPGGTDTFTYNDRGDLLTAGGPSGSTSYGYDADDRMTLRADATGTATFGYDADSDVTSEDDPVTGTTISTTYDTVRQPQTVTYGTGGPTMTYGFNTLHQLTSQVLKSPAGTTRASIAYGYNPDGEVASRTTTGLAGTGQNTYTYDQAGRLKNWNDGSATTTYTYDPDGNRLSAGSETAVYNALDQITSTTQGAATTHYAYTQRGSLSSVSDGTQTTTYTSDAFDDQTGSSAGTSYAYDGLGRLATATSGTTTGQFVYAGSDDNPVSDGTQEFGRDASGDLLSSAQADGGGAQFAFDDSHEDVTATFSPADATITGSSATDPFGAPTASSGTRSDLGYQGGWTDPTSGLVEAGARWYDPSLGDFTSADTITNSPSPAVNANPYAYGDDDPLDYADPSGHDACASDDLKAIAERQAEIARQAKLAHDRWLAQATRQMRQQMQENRDRSQAEEEQYRNNVRRINGSSDSYTNTSDGYHWSSNGHNYQNGDDVVSGDGYGYLDGLYGAIGAGTAVSWGYGLSGASAAGSELPSAWGALEGLAPELPEALGTVAAEFGPEALALAASVSDDCGAAGIPHKAADQNLSTADTAPTIGTTPAEDPAAAAAHDGVSSAAATDTGVTTATDVSLDSGPDDERGDKCDTGAGFNVSDTGVVQANMVYLPRHLQAGECVATGAFANLTKSDYTGAQRPRLSFALPGLRTLPSKNRARGHLIGYAMGGSNNDTRNFVPLYQKANQVMYNSAEDPVVKAIKGGGHEFVEVFPVYGNPTSPIPTSIDFDAFGTVDVDCQIMNTPSGSASCR